MIRKGVTHLFAMLMLVSCACRSKLLHVLMIDTPLRPSANVEVIKNFVSPYPCDQYALAIHGHHIASIILKGNESRMKLFSIGLPDGSYSGKFFDEIDRAIHKNDIRIVNVSGGDTIEDPNYKKWKEGWEKVISKHSDVIFSVSAGNNGEDLDVVQPVPAVINRSNVIVTGSSDGAKISSFSNFGKAVDQLRPGEKVSGQSVCDEDGRITLSGSSQATALTTNELIQSMSSKFTPD
jgi:Subtilase family